jgi:O-antigen/teichoic acid export membrane protein/aminoglycoside phosphotransferase
MMFLAGAAELNLMSALVRFLPGAGRQTHSLVRTVYLASLATAMVAAAGFLAVLGWVAPKLGFLTSNPLIAAWFLVSTMAWAVFVLQDSALTGLSRTWLVPVENAGYALAKLVLVFALASVLPGTGIFVSWTLALVVSVLPVNVFLFKRAIPAHQREAAPGLVPATGSEIVRFAATDYGGAVAWLAAVYLLPLLVLDMAGAKANSVYAVCWVIAYTLYLVSGNMGVSLVLETASTSSELAVCFRRVVSQTMRMLVPAVAVLVVAAPLVLRVFGPGYSAGGTTIMRLLVLSAIPNVVTASAVSALRAQNRTSTGTAILVLLCALVIGISALLLPVVGVVGVGLAWLIGQSATALIVLSVPTLWPRALAAEDRPTWAHRLAFAGAMVVDRLQRLGIWTPSLPFIAKVGAKKRVDETLALEGAQPAVLASAFASHDMPAVNGCLVVTSLRTFSDLTVARIGPAAGQPTAVIKVAKSSAAVVGLQANVQAISQLRADHRLGTWVRLLPDVLASELSSDRGYVLESCVDGVDGRSLSWGNPETAERTMTAAAATISDLHSRTARAAVLDDDLLQAWVDAPVADIAALYPPTDWRARSASRLAAHLRDQLIGQTVTLGWIHGDYTPGNLMMSSDGDAVLGIVDWGGARADGLGYLDTGLLLLSTRMLRQRQQIGKVLIDLMRGQQLTSAEQTAMEAGVVPSGDPTGLLLCWLHHVATNLNKAAYYARHLQWRTLNVDAVLREVGQW